MSEQIEIYIETLTGVSFEIQVCPCDSIGSIKAKIQYFEGIPISQQHLIWQNQELDDQACFQDYNIVDGATLKLVLGLRGGPINTKRVGSNSLTKIAHLICDNDLVDPLDTNPFTLIVFQDGVNIRMYTIINKDGEEIPTTSTRYNSTESLRTPSPEVEKVNNPQTDRENDVLQKKMAVLQSKMKHLSISKKSKLKNSHQQDLSPNKDKLPPINKEKPRSALNNTDPLTFTHDRSSHSKLKGPLGKISRCTSTLKAMGVKLPNRTSSLTAKSTSGLRFRSYTNLPVNEKPKFSQTDHFSMPRPRTSPQFKSRTDTDEFHKLLSSTRKLAHPHSSKYSFLSSSSKRMLHRPALPAYKPLGMPTRKPFSPVLKEDQLLPPIVPKKRKSSKRCSWCKKKTGLATSYTCRCGKNFCGTHRYAETHNCTYDYKTEDF